MFYQNTTKNNQNDTLPGWLVCDSGCFLMSEVISLEVFDELLNDRVSYP